MCFPWFPETAQSGGFAEVCVNEFPPIAKTWVSLPGNSWADECTLQRSFPGRMGETREASKSWPKATAGGYPLSFCGSKSPAWVSADYD
eukprot:1841571-Heterocapsa_arctica.AAC.1